MLNLNSSFVPYNIHWLVTALGVIWYFSVCNSIPKAREEGWCFGHVKRMDANRLPTRVLHCLLFVVLMTDIWRIKRCITVIATSKSQRRQRNRGIYTHPFNGFFSATTRVSRYQKGKTNLDFTEARDSEWQWHQLGHMQVCTLLQTDNHTSTPPLSFFTGRMPFLLPNQQHQSTERIKGIEVGNQKQKVAGQVVNVVSCWQVNSLTTWNVNESAHWRDWSCRRQWS